MDRTENDLDNPKNIEITHEQDLNSLEKFKIMKIVRTPPNVVISQKSYWADKASKGR